MKYPQLGAIVGSAGTTFRVWAPQANRIEVVFEGGAPPLPLEKQQGYYAGTRKNAGEGTRYRLRLNDDALFPDPASRSQPDGVHGASCVVDHRSFRWQDGGWSGVARENLVFYELHTGTFTSDGTFDGVQARLQHLTRLGITAIELMPVAAFPGERNWGYDPAALYAPASAYGTPAGLRRLVDAAHQAGLAVFLDVIYNHLGPDGAYVAAFAPMFTERHHTPWGAAINLDDRDSAGVRGLFIDNALHWLREYHFDGLRLDATHALIDDGPTHFLAELSAAVEGLDGPRRYLVAEDPRNVNTVVRPRSAHGYGMDAIWTDDFHHQIRNMIAGDREGYYEDYDGSTMREVAETIRNGWYFDGRPSPTTGAPRGTDSADVGYDQCVICIQNHDQVGNRPTGERLSSEIDPAQYRAASALLLFLPHLPLLFMGQEWAASTPFLYFTDHNDDLGKLVTEGRRKEFESFSGFRGTVPDPQDPATFAASVLDWRELESAPHAHVYALYRALLALRIQLIGDPDCTTHGDRAITVTRGRHDLIVTLDAAEALPLPPGGRPVLHTEQPAYVSDARPPDVDGERVRFRRAGAMVVIRNQDRDILDDRPELFR